MRKSAWFGLCYFANVFSVLCVPSSPHVCDLWPGEFSNSSRSHFMEWKMRFWISFLLWTVVLRLLGWVQCDTLWRSHMSYIFKSLGYWCGTSFYSKSWITYSGAMKDSRLGRGEVLRRLSSMMFSIFEYILVLKINFVSLRIPLKFV